MMGELPCLTHQQVADLVFLQMRPDVFRRIEFRSVCGQSLDGDAAFGGCHVLRDQLGAMNRSTVPDDHHWLASVALKHFEEIHHLGRLDGSGVNAEKNPPQADGTDYRQAFPTERFPDDRSLTTGCPRPHPVGLGAYPRLVDENDQTPFTAGFFLMAGHLWRFQWRIFSSSRSMARRDGRWQLKPMAASTLLTWPGW